MKELFWVKFYLKVFVKEEERIKIEVEERGAFIF